ncbi:MAG TPA: DUF885 domain-containing protein [Candidatus Bathyarchaeia archaeon]|nr:DUF885 domain-containing protein [Candidatus Bathyarchaeia archaeon]
MRFLVLALVVIACAVGLFAQSSKGLDARRAQLREAIQAEWEYTLRTHPEFATFVGDNRYNDKLGDYSAAAEQKAVEHAKTQLKIFEAIDTTGFPDDETLNQQLMVRRLKMAIEGGQFKDWEMPVNQFGGAHLGFASMPTRMPFNSVRDYDNYVARLHQISRALSQITDNMKLGMHDGLMPPKYLLEKVAVQAQEIANATGNKSPFAEPLSKFPAGVSAAEQARIRKAVAESIQDEVIPAYTKFAAFVKTEYAPKGRTTLGINSLPNGDALYQHYIRELTTCDLAAIEIHQIGLKQVDEIEAQLLTIANRQGFADVKSFNEHIRRDPKLHGTSGQQILDLYQHYTDQMYAKLPELFGRLPQGKLVVVPMESYRQPSSPPADYDAGLPDGSRPGRINVNEYQPEKRLLLNLEAIAYHEGVPGHHLQFSISTELTDIPPFRKYTYLPAYNEGWALYSERLGKEVGFYQDPYSEYGRLENEMWRSIRLVVDTGVHSMHWTREQMVDYFHKYTAMDEPNIQTEVDRYIAWPAQALSYKLGQIEIVSLREHAKKELGSKFDIKSFHDEVLGAGALPLDMLHARVTAWIVNQK